MFKKKIIFVFSGIAHLKTFYMMGIRINIKTLSVCFLSVWIPTMARAIIRQSDYVYIAPTIHVSTATRISYHWLYRKNLFSLIHPCTTHS